MAGSELNNFPVLFYNPNPLWPSLGHFLPSGSFLLGNFYLLSLDPSSGLAGVNPRATKAINSVPLVGDFYGPLLKTLTDPTDQAGGGYNEYDLNGDPNRLTNAGCDFNGQKDKNPSLFVFPYDWRLSNTDNALRLKDYVGCVRRFYPDPNVKIDVLTHSMGGLVARSYILQSPYVGRLITIAAPWVGVPKAIDVMESGSFLDPGLGRLITRASFKQLSEFFPSVHQLLPSRSYFDLAGPAFAPYGEDGRWITDYNEFSTILNAQFPRSTPATTGGAFHDTSGQDDWRADTSAQYYHIYGVKALSDTVGAVYNITQPTCGLLGCKTRKIFGVTFTRGDGTVPKLSAERISPRSGLNLNAPTAVLKPFTKDNSSCDPALVEHTALTQNRCVQDYILSVLSGNAQAQKLIAGTQAQEPAAQPAYYLRVTGASSIKITDAFGNTTDPFSDPPDAGLVGVTSIVLGNESALVVMPADQSYTITLHTGIDALAIDLTKATDTETTQAVRYLDLSLPSGVTAILRLTPLGPENLRYDKDGDGIFETIVNPTVSVAGTAAQDIDAPIVTINSATQGTSALITITSSDIGSGVKATYFSLNGTNFQSYTAPFTVNPYQAPAIYAFADDNVGNRSGLVTYRLINPGVPVLVSEANSTRAIALDSVLWLREPFQLSYAYSWGSDRRTRIMLFAMNFDLSPGENASAVTATAQDGSNRVYGLPVEYVGKMPGSEWLTSVVVKLNDEIGDVGDVLVQISYHGVPSNRVRVGIGHIGGGPPNNITSLPIASRPPR